MLTAFVRWPDGTRSERTFQTMEDILPWAKEAQAEQVTVCEPIPPSEITDEIDLQTLVVVEQYTREDLMGERQDEAPVSNKKRSR